MSRVSYCSAIVTPAWLFDVPICTTTGFLLLGSASVDLLGNRKR